MSRSQALSVWKSIRRNHPFFREGGMFGFDWNTFHVVDPYACAVLRQAVKVAS